MSLMMKCPRCLGTEFRNAIHFDETLPSGKVLDRDHESGTKGGITDEEPVLKRVKPFNRFSEIDIV